MPSPTAPGPSISSSRPALSETEPAFGVYIHWPFCEAKCPYCDFNSHVRHGGIDEARFRNAYLSEISHMGELSGPRQVSSIFFGGGTPSRMTPQTCEAILDAIAATWNVGPDVEITLEANPTSVEADKFAAFRAAGVNRVSIGLQSLDDADLKALGRTHTVAEGLAALDVAEANFERFSFDLIYARSGQSVSQWRDELIEALARARGHLSLYQLTIEPDTRFADLHAAGKLRVPGEDDAATFYEVTQELCAAAGLPAYEISNHAAPGQKCQHNLVYWTSGDYAGIGPGAHGRIARDGQRYATICEANPEEWCARVERDGHGMTTNDVISEADRRDEFLVMGLRLSEGLDMTRYGALGGRFDLQRLDALADGGLIKVANKHVIPTTRGRLLLNSLIAELAM